MTKNAYHILNKDFSIALNTREKLDEKKYGVNIK